MVMPTVRCFTLGSCLAVVLLAGVAAGSEDKPIVAVFDIENRDSGLSEKALLNLTDYMVGLLAESGYSIIPRDQLKARLLEQKQDSHRTCYEQNCQVELGREMAAQKSLSSQIFQLGGACRITITMYDLRKAATDQAVTSKAECNEKELVNAIEEAIKKLSVGNKPKVAIAAPPPVVAAPAVAATPTAPAPPPAVQPVEQAAAQKPPAAEQPLVEPDHSHRNFRLQAIVNAGAGGKTKVKTDTDTVTLDMDGASVGGGVGVEYLVWRFLGLGMRFHYDTFKPIESQDRFKSAQVLFVPTGRLSFGDLEAYLALPLGLASIIPPADYGEKRTAFALHALGGVHYWLGARIGLFAELGAGIAVYKAPADNFGHLVDRDITTSEGRFQLGVTFGI